MAEQEAKKSDRPSVQQENRSPRDSRGVSKTPRRPRGRRSDRGSEPGYDHKVIEIRRVARTVKGGKRMRFRALVVVGDRKGKIGMGLRKGLDVADSVQKAINEAQQNMVDVSLNENTVPHRIKSKYKSSEVYLQPAAPGTGVIAGGAVRQILDLAGVKDILSKIHGSRSKVNVTNATIKALGALRTKDELNKKLNK